MAEVQLGANQYGKAENRVVRIVRDTPRHEIRDLNVSTSLRGAFSDAHTTGDQAQVRDVGRTLVGRQDCDHRSGRVPHQDVTWAKGIQFTCQRGCQINEHPDRADLNGRFRGIALGEEHLVGPLSPGGPAALP